MSPMSDHPGGGSDGVLNCGDPYCEVCWLWPRPGEGWGDWLTRLRAHPTPRSVDLLRIAPAASKRWSSS